jgi:hypothetical protein
MNVKFCLNSLEKKHWSLVKRIKIKLVPAIATHIATRMLKLPIVGFGCIAY